jgi:hypothetical protein
MMTFEELVEKWTRRDELYGRRKWQGQFIPLSKTEQASIRWWRRLEVNDLMPGARAAAVEEIQHWEAPVLMR